MLNDASLPSDHAPIAVRVQPTVVDGVALVERARRLGDHATLHSPCDTSFRKSAKYSSIDEELFKRELSRCDIPELVGDTDVTIDTVTDILYKCAKDSKRNPTPAAAPVDSQLHRWEKLLNDPNDKRMWEAINWRGEYKEKKDEKATPSDEEFKVFFEGIYSI